MTRPRVKKLMRSAGNRVARLDAAATPHWLIVRAVRTVIPRRFDPAAARDLQASFELRIRDPHGGGCSPFALRIAGGRCEVYPGPAADAGAVATLGADDMIRLASGAVGWPQLMSSGRLELTGDPFLALRFPSLFRLPVQ